MTEQEMQDLFRGMRDEPVPADSLARVRMGVEGRIRNRLWWKSAVALVAAACIVAGFMFLRPARTPVRTVEPAPLEIAQVQSTPQPTPAPPVRTVSRTRRTRPRPIENVPVLIRIETPDPDVVILLVN